MGDELTAHGEMDHLVSPAAIRSGVTSSDPLQAPFTRVGPGQSMRLAYQVMGKNGPIPNPSGIRFIPVEGMSTDIARPPAGGLPGSLPDASALMGLAQLANLGVGVANLGVSAAILVEVRKQSRMLRELQAGMTEFRTGVEQLLEMTERIDINVAEVQLRETLRHAMKSAIREGEADLVLLTDLLAKALNRFVQSLGGQLNPGARRDLVLSSDVREMAEACMNLLYAGRVTALEAHNQSCGGSAVGVVRDDTVQLHMQRLAETAALLGTTGTGVNRMANEVGDSLRSNKRFLGRSGDVRGQIRKLLKHLDKDLEALMPVAPARVLLKELEDQQVFAQAREAGADALAGMAQDYLVAWLAHTDAGLLWRLRHELDLQQDSAYWAPLSDWLTPLTGSNSDGMLGAERSLYAVAA